MGLASELPGVKEDILGLFGALYAAQHVCEEFNLRDSSEFLAMEYLAGHNARAFGFALAIAVKLRSFFDINRNNSHLQNVLSAADSLHGCCCRQITPEEKELSFREACNKLIHSLNAQIVMGRIDSRKFDPPIEFSNEVPTEEVEVTGNKNGEAWLCRVDLKLFSKHAFSVYQDYESRNIT